MSANRLQGDTSFGGGWGRFITDKPSSCWSRGFTLERPASWLRNGCLPCAVERTGKYSPSYHNQPSPVSTSSCQHRGLSLPLLTRYDVWSRADSEPVSGPLKTTSLAYTSPHPPEMLTKSVLAFIFASVCFVQAIPVPSVCKVSYFICGPLSFNGSSPAFLVISDR